MLHPVPSLGYQLLRRVKKLRPEYAHLPGPELGVRRSKYGSTRISLIFSRFIVLMTSRV